MSPEGKRALIAVVRRVVFTGLIIIGAWLLLLWLRGHIPESIIRTLNEEIDNRPGNTPLSGIPPLSYDSSTWDWSRSLWATREIGSSVRIPVSELMRGRLQGTLKFIGLAALISLVVSYLLLLAGMLISRVTGRPGWLARLRSILRLVIVSTGASAPTFSIFIWYIVFMTATQPSPQRLGPTAAMLFWGVFFSSTLLTWLLVQSGLGELAGLPDGTPLLVKIGRLGVNLLIRLFRLTGVIIVIAVVGEQLSAQAGLGRPLIDSINQRDFPLMFWIVWVLVIMVAIGKLVGDLLEITANQFLQQSEPTGSLAQEPVHNKGIPKGWLVFSLVLVMVSIVVAIIGPMLAPYGWNQIDLQSRMAAPSVKHLLGADNVGRDILSRLLYGVRLDVFTGLLCAGVLFVIAAAWAMLAGYFRKLNNWVGDSLEDLVTLPAQILGVFPWLVLLLVLTSLINMNGSSGGVRSLYLGWPLIPLLICIVLLPRTVGVIQECYRSAPAEKSVFQSILLAVPVMVIFTVAGGILYVSTVGYLGVGVPPPFPELGSILAGGGLQYMMVAPWMALWPAVALILLLLAWVMAGEALLEKLGFRSKAVWAKIME